MYISMSTCKYRQSYRHSQYINKCTYKHQVLSLVRQDRLPGVKSKKSHLGKWTSNHQWGNSKGSSRGNLSGYTGIGILDGLERFCHYCFAREVSIITYYTSLVAIFKKDVATLSQRIQSILLRIHQFWVRILYKPGPDLFIADWLSKHNHTENRDPEIPGRDIKVDAIQTATNIPECMSIPQLQQATTQDDHLQWLRGTSS